MLLHYKRMQLVTLCYLKVLISRLGDTQNSYARLYPAVVAREDTL